MFYFTLPVFVFSRTVSVFVGPSTHRVGSNVVSFELQLHSHAGLLHLSLKTSTSVDPPASPPPCGSTSTSTSERHEPQLHHRPCRSPELYLFSRANLTLTWSAGPPIKLLHLMIWEWEHVAINPSDLLLALAIKKTKSTQQTGRAPWFTITRITPDVTLLATGSTRPADHFSPSRISAHFQGKKNEKTKTTVFPWPSIAIKTFNATGRCCAARAWILNDIRSSKKTRWDNIPLKTYCRPQISRI